MNGFTNAILTVLLGWLRSLFAAIWTLLGSDGGGAILDFLRANWKVLFLILCVGGFVVDRIVYLIRWRPYYVWRARRARRRQGWDDEPEGAGAPPYGGGYYPADHPDAYAGSSYEQEYDPYQPQPTERYAPRRHDYAAAPTSRYLPPERRHTDSYPLGKRVSQGPTQPYGQPVPPPPTPRHGRGEPTAYQPDASYAPTAAFRPQQFLPPVEPEPFDGELRFDDDLAAWNAPRSGYDQFAPRLAPENNPAYGMDSSFGAPQPEPAQYLRDVQAGFAPQPAPEQRYTPPPREPEAPAAPRTEASATEPVHPGLDVETFQQNIGLTGNAELTDAARRVEEGYADFTPFAAVPAQEGPLAKPRGLGALAKKARNFVSGEDERNPLSIRDLQPTVDVKSAFRAPVYPQKPPGSEDDA